MTRDLGLPGIATISKHLRRASTFHILFGKTLRCDYSNQGHPTKFSTNLMNKNRGGLIIVFHQIIRVIKLYVTKAADMWSFWIICWKTSTILFSLNLWNICRVVLVREGHPNSTPNSRPVCKPPVSLNFFIRFDRCDRCFREYAELQAKVLEERRKWQEEQEMREKQGS